MLSTAMKVSVTEHSHDIIPTGQIFILIVIIVKNNKPHNKKEIVKSCSMIPSL